jgi:hypothetical protein
LVLWRPTKRLVAKLAAPLGKGAIVVLTGKDHHGDAVSARYHPRFGKKPEGIARECGKFC